MPGVKLDARVNGVLEAENDVTDTTLAWAPPIDAQKENKCFPYVQVQQCK